MIQQKSYQRLQWSWVVADVFNPMYYTGIFMIMLTRSSERILILCIHPCSGVGSQRLVPKQSENDNYNLISV